MQMLFGSMITRRNLRLEEQSAFIKRLYWSTTRGTKEEEPLCGARVLKSGSLGFALYVHDPRCRIKQLLIEVAGNMREPQARAEQRVVMSGAKGKRETV